MTFMMGRVSELFKKGGFTVTVRILVSVFSAVLLYFKNYKTYLAKVWSLALTMI
jgi:hypothetical protein